MKYEYIGGIHMFTGEGLLKGLWVANYDLEMAIKEVAFQTENLLRYKVKCISPKHEE